VGDFEVESMGGAEPVGIDTGDEPDLGADQRAVTGRERIADTRFDPAFLWAEIKAEDWRMKTVPGTPPNALGVNHPAVDQGGIIRFLEPVPQDGHSNFAGDAGGGKSPWPFRAVKLGIDILCPPTPSSLYEIPATGDPYTEAFPSHSQMLADIILRGTLSIEFGGILILPDLPVSLVGGMGGAAFTGDHFGAANNMLPSWTNAFKLPDELVFDPDRGSALKAYIRLNAADLVPLASGKDEGWGQPFAMQNKIEDDGSNPQKVVKLPALYFGVRFVLWGQKGLNIRAGKSSIAKATAARR